ncbi:retroviral-like aspartic protease family protein [Massilia sp. SYSU DXS3249]
MNKSFFRSAAALSFCACAALAHPTAAAADPPGCKYVEVARLPLQYTGPALQVTTVGSINNTPATMLVDTGAWQTVLTRTGTERRDMVLRNTGRYARGVGGSARIYETRVKEFSTGIAGGAKGYMKVLTDFGATPTFDAIIGAPFLLQADLEISLATKEMKFFRPLDCKDQFLAYWSPDAVVVPFEYESRDNPNPRFTVTVNGVKMAAIIDTGAATTSITLRAAKRAGLKLDAPGVTRAGVSYGIGERKPPRWRTSFDTFQIGDETVSNAEIAVIDYEGEVDVLLGDDFLRSHRVLFAMSQKKLYISYLGGEPFGQRRTLEPWITAEAEAGNADAQIALADIYMRGKLVPRDAARGSALLEKAAAGGNPLAGIATGRSMMLRGLVPEGATRIRAGLDKLPSHRSAALWLYIARLRTGQPELAATELKANFARNEDDEWPGPIADFYLGKMSAEALLKAAGEDSASAHRRTCQAIAAMAEWHGARGEKEQSGALSARLKEQCAAPQPNAVADANAAAAQQ